MCITFPICNKKAHRAPKILGKTFILCWRCTGVLLGAILASFIIKYPEIPHSRLPLLFLIPMSIDGSLQYILNIESNNKRRFVTGFIAGLAALTYF